MKNLLANGEKGDIGVDHNVMNVAIKGKDVATRCDVAGI